MELLPGWHPKYSQWKSGDEDNEGGREEILDLLNDHIRAGYSMFKEKMDELTNNCHWE
jgi:hypothetical protein